MESAARWSTVLGGMTALMVLGADITEAKPIAERASVRSRSCPCAADPFFASFLNGQRPLVACTDNGPMNNNFVRLVEANVDLVVLFDFPPQLYCGAQPAGSPTAAMPITAAQFMSCKRLIVNAAARRGIPCVPEVEN